MKTVALLSQKGGSGKSTLAVHMAVIAQTAGRRTVIIDLDPQRSAAGWWETRASETPEMVETSPGELRAVLDAARADGVDLCVLDTRPSAGADAAAAAALSDLVLIPTRPAIFDLKAIAATVDIVTAAKVTALIVMNGTPPPEALGRHLLRPTHAAPYPTTALSSPQCPLACGPPWHMPWWTAGPSTSSTPPARPRWR